MSKITEVLQEVEAERHRQELRWGDQRQHPLFTYNAILVEEVGEVSKALVEEHFGSGDITQAREELIQVAAVACAMVEAIDYRIKVLG